MSCLSIGLARICYCKVLGNTGSSKRKGAKVGGGSSVRADWQCICCPKLVGGKFKLGTFLFHELVLQLGCTIMTSAEREGEGAPICRHLRFAANLIIRADQHWEPA